MTYPSSLPPPSLLVQVGIPGLALLMAGLFVAASFRAGGARLGLRAAAGLLALMGAASGLALSGVLADATRRPPLLMPLVMGTLIVTAVAAMSRFGARIAATFPLWALVGAQAFRLPLELVMHRAADDGAMPVEMSFSGYNFDIVTGAGALALSALLFYGRASRTLVYAWNVLGAALLANIVSIAVAALPWFAAFGPDHVNEWVLYFPYTWLATVLVPAALFGHVVIFKKLAAERGASEQERVAATSAVSA